MRELDLAALRAHGTARSGADVVAGAAGMGAGPAGPPLGYCHNRQPFLPSAGALKLPKRANRYSTPFALVSEGFILISAKGVSLLSLRH